MLLFSNKILYFFIQNVVILVWDLHFQFFHRASGKSPADLWKSRWNRKRKLSLREVANFSSSQLTNEICLEKRRKYVRGREGKKGQADLPLLWSFVFKTSRREIKKKYKNDDTRGIRVDLLIKMQIKQSSAESATRHSFLSEKFPDGWNVVTFLYFRFWKKYFG